MPFYIYDFNCELHMDFNTLMHFLDNPHTIIVLLSIFVWLFKSNWNYRFVRFFALLDFDNFTFLKSSCKITDSQNESENEKR